MHCKSVLGCMQPLTPALSQRERGMKSGPHPDPLPEGEGDQARRGRRRSSDSRLWAGAKWSTNGSAAAIPRAWGW